MGEGENEPSDAIGGGDPAPPTPAVPEPSPGLRYQTSKTIEGDPLQAAERAIQTLANAGFRIEDRAGGWARLSSPGLQSSRQPAIFGATTIEIRSGFGRLEADADLRGVLRLSRFARWFPIGLVLLLTVPWLILGLAGVLPRVALLAPGIVLVVQLVIWSIVGPWMGRALRRRTERAVDTLVHNAAMGV